MVICENCIFVNDSSRAVHAVPYAVHAVLKHPLAMKIPGRALSLSNLPVCCCSSLCLDKFGRAAAAERNVENRITETVVWSVSLTFLCFHLCSGIPGGFFFTTSGWEVVPHPPRLAGPEAYRNPWLSRPQKSPAPCAASRPPPPHPELHMLRCAIAFDAALLSLLGSCAPVSGTSAGPPFQPSPLHNHCYYRTTPPNVPERMRSLPGS